MTTNVLETERLILRPPALGDEQAFIDYYTSERSKYTGGPVPIHRASVFFFAELGHWQARGYGLWAVTDRNTGDLLGRVGPFFPVGWPEQELGWIVYPQAEGKGIAQEAAIAARTHVFSELGWKTAVSYIAPENARSIALAERLGATLDTDAKQPKADTPCLVYRHPVPEAA